MWAAYLIAFLHLCATSDEILKKDDPPYLIIENILRGSFLGSPNIVKDRQSGRWLFPFNLFTLRNEFIRIESVIGQNHVSATPFIQSLHRCGIRYVDRDLFN